MACGCHSHISKSKLLLPYTENLAWVGNLINTQLLSSLQLFMSWSKFLVAGTMRMPTVLSGREYIGRTREFSELVDGLKIVHLFSRGNPWLPLGWDGIMTLWPWDKALPATLLSLSRILQTQLAWLRSMQRFRICSILFQVNISHFFFFPEWLLAVCCCTTGIKPLEFSVRSQFYSRAQDPLNPYIFHKQDL